MSAWLRGLRGLLGRDGADEAYRREERLLRAASVMPSVQEAFAADMANLGASGAASVVVGTAARDPSLAVRVPLSEYAGLSHSLTLGSPGSGKTFGTLAAVAQLLRGFATDPWTLGRAEAPEAPGVAIADYKSELRELALGLADDVARGLGRAEARALEDAVVVFDPFSTSGVLPMNLVWPDPQVSPETQAYDVASLIDLAAGPQLGVNQDAFTYHLLLLGIHKGDSSLAELHALTYDLPALVSLAAQSPSEDVRLYFSAMRRGGPTSLPGVQSRLSRLLRVPSLRAMLTARGSTSFAKLFASKFLVADVGSPPLGMESLARFAGGLLTLKVSRAVFERANRGADRRLALFVDEFQEGLSGTDADVADAYGRLLTQARSRGISMHLITQSLDRVARAAPSLPEVISSTTALAFIYRSSLRNARGLEHMLPVTGRRPRDPGAPWEERGGSPFLSPAEEMRRLVEEVTRLPDRHFYLWNGRRADYKGELVRALTIQVTPKPRDPAGRRPTAAGPRPLIGPARGGAGGEGPRQEGSANVAAHEVGGAARRENGVRRAGVVVGWRSDAPSAAGVDRNIHGDTPAVPPEILGPEIPDRDQNAETGRTGPGGRRPLNPHGAQRQPTPHPADEDDRPPPGRGPGQGASRRPRRPRRGG